jgi:tetratricopeptide (TPR) repeat protein
VRWLEQNEDRLDPVLTLWEARLLARRREFAEARALLERPALAQDRQGRDEILEGWCEVLREEGAWDEGRRVATRAAEHASWAGVAPLALYAERLGAASDLAFGRPDDAANRLERVVAGFGELGASWEAAVTALDLGRAMQAAGRVDEARRMVQEAVPVFDRVRSLRELTRAGDLLDELG